MNRYFITSTMMQGKDEPYTLWILIPSGEVYRIGQFYNKWEQPYSSSRYDKSTLENDKGLQEIPEHVAIRLFPWAFYTTRLQWFKYAMKILFKHIY